jgi:hypothetical protein
VENEAMPGSPAVKKKNLGFDKTEGAGMQRTQRKDQKDTNGMSRHGGDSPIADEAFETTHDAQR